MDCSSTPDFWIVPLIAYDLVRCILGLLGDARLAWLLLSDTTPQMLNLNLLMLDVVQSLLHLADAIVIWVNPGIFKNMRKALLIFSTSGCPQLLAYMCFERCVAVVWPRRYPLLATYRYREACCAMTWVSAVALTAAVFLSENLVLSHFFTVFLALSGCLMIFSDNQIIRVLRRAGPGSNRDSNLDPVKVKACKTVRWILAAVGLSYVPCTIVYAIAPVVPKMFNVTSTVALMFLFIVPMFYPMIILYSKGRIMRCCSRTSEEM